MSDYRRSILLPTDDTSFELITWLVSPWPTPHSSPGSVIGGGVECKGMVIIMNEAENS